MELRATPPGLRRRPIHYFLDIPYKSSTHADSDFVDRSRRWIEQHWGAVAWEQVSESLRYLSKQRSEFLMLFHSSLSPIFRSSADSYAIDIASHASRYVYCLQQLIQETSYADESTWVQSLNLRWSHCFDSDVAQSIVTSFRVERVSALYDVAALCSLFACKRVDYGSTSDQLTSEDLCKQLASASRAFRGAAIILARVTKDISDDRQLPCYQPSQQQLDLLTISLPRMRQLMLAQAQECAYYLALQQPRDQISSNQLAAIAKQCSDYYRRVLPENGCTSRQALADRLAGRSPLNKLSENGIPDLWFPYAGTMYDYYRAVCLYEQADVGSILTVGDRAGVRTAYVIEARRILLMRMRDNKRLLADLSLRWIATTQQVDKVPADLRRAARKELGMNPIERHGRKQFTVSRPGSDGESEGDESEPGSGSDDGTDGEDVPSSDRSRRHRQQIDSLDQEGSLYARAVDIACKYDRPCTLLRHLVDVCQTETATLDKCSRFMRTAFEQLHVRQPAPTDNDVRLALDISGLSLVEDPYTRFENAILPSADAPAPAGHVNMPLRRATESGRAARKLIQDTDAQLAARMNSLRPMPQGGDASTDRAPSGTSVAPSSALVIPLVSSCVLRLTHQRRSICDRFQDIVLGCEDELLEFVKEHPDVLVYASLYSLRYENREFASNFYGQSLVSIKSDRQQFDSLVTNTRRELGNLSAINLELLSACETAVTPDNARVGDDGTETIVPRIQTLKSLIEYYRGVVTAALSADEKVCALIDLNAPAWRAIRETPQDRIMSKIFVERELELMALFDPLINDPEHQTAVNTKLQSMCQTVGMSTKDFNTLLDTASGIVRLLSVQIAQRDAKWEELHREDGFEQLKVELLNALREAAIAHPFESSALVRRFDGAMQTTVSRSVDEKLIKLAEIKFIDELAERTKTDRLVEHIGEQKWGRLLSVAQGYAKSQKDFIAAWNTASFGKPTIRARSSTITITDPNAADGAKLYAWFEASRAYLSLKTLRANAFEFHQNVQTKLRTLHEQCTTWRTRYTESIRIRQLELEIQRKQEQTRRQQEKIRTVDIRGSLPSPKDVISRPMPLPNQILSDEGTDDYRRARNRRVPSNVRSTPSPYQYAYDEDASDNFATSTTAETTSLIDASLGKV